MHAANSVAESPPSPVHVAVAAQALPQRVQLARAVTSPCPGAACIAPALGTKAGTAGAPGTAGCPSEGAGVDQQKTVSRGGKECHTSEHCSVLSGAAPSPCGAGQAASAAAGGIGSSMLPERSSRTCVVSVQGACCFISCGGRAAARCPEAAEPWSPAVPAGDCPLPPWSARLLLAPVVPARRRAASSASAAAASCLAAAAAALEGADRASPAAARSAAVTAAGSNPGCQLACGATSGWPSAAPGRAAGPAPLGQNRPRRAGTASACGSATAAVPTRCCCSSSRARTSARRKHQRCRVSLFTRTPGRRPPDAPLEAAAATPPPLASCPCLSSSLAASAPACSACASGPPAAATALPAAAACRRSWARNGGGMGREMNPLHSGGTAPGQGPGCRQDQASSCAAPTGALALGSSSSSQHGMLRTRLRHGRRAAAWRSSAAPRLPGSTTSITFVSSSDAPRPAPASAPTAAGSSTVPAPSLRRCIGLGSGWSAPPAAASAAAAAATAARTLVGEDSWPARQLSR